MRVLIVLLALVLCGPAFAEDQVKVPPLEGTVLTALLFPAPEKTPHPAVVFMHGCGGLWNKEGTLVKRETTWAEKLNALGYTVLVLDSFTVRGIKNMCSAGTFDPSIYIKRAKDAYGALLWLQARPDIAPERIAVMGWSQGGGSVLHTVAKGSPGRPAALPRGDFRAGIAFYPGSCDERKTSGWSTAIPLQVLVGGSDVWTPAGPCKQLIENAAAAGSPTAITIFPGAYHDFDWPGVPVHELPAFRTSSGVVPIEGEDPAAEAEAYRIVPEFLAAKLGK